MSKQKAAKTYPNTIFKQTTPDETQELNGGPRFQTWYKGFLTRSEIYERMMPDGLTSALRIDGPDSGGAAIVINSKGNVKLITGKRTASAIPNSPLTYISGTLVYPIPGLRIVNESIIHLTPLSDAIFFLYPKPGD